MTIYSLDVLLSRFGTNLLFYVQFQLLLLDLHTDFSGGRSGSLVFPSLSEFSTVCRDPHSQRLWCSQQSRSRCFSGIPSLSAIKDGVICISEVIDISPGNLDSSCALSSMAFCMMYTAYKLNKQHNNMQPCCTLFPVLKQTFVSWLLFLTAAS